MNIGDIANTVTVIAFVVGLVLGLISSLLPLYLARHQTKNANRQNIINQLSKDIEALIKLGAELRLLIQDAIQTAQTSAKLTETYLLMHSMADNRIIEYAEYFYMQSTPYEQKLKAITAAIDYLSERRHRLIYEGTPGDWQQRPRKSRGQGKLSQARQRISAVAEKHDDDKHTSEILSQLPPENKRK